MWSCRVIWTAEMAIDDRSTGEKNKHVPRRLFAFVKLPHRTETVLVLMVGNQQRIEEVAMLYAS